MPDTLNSISAVLALNIVVIVPFWLSTELDLFYGNFGGVAKLLLWFDNWLNKNKNKKFCDKMLP